MRLLVIFGPPAVGKMTVGREIARRSEWRAQVVEEAAGSGTDLVLTFVWGLELQDDVEEITRYIRPYVEKGADVAFVELLADLDTRLRRNRTDVRLAEKRSKRDVEWSDANVREMERFVMNTDDRAGAALPSAALLDQHRHLRLDNGDLAPEEAAAHILAWLDTSPTEGAPREPTSCRT